MRLLQHSMSQLCIGQAAYSMTRALALMTHRQGVEGVMQRS